MIVFGIFQRSKWWNTEWDLERLYSTFEKAEKAKKELEKEEWPGWVYEVRPLEVDSDKPYNINN